MIQLPPRSTRTDTLFPYTTLFRSEALAGANSGRIHTFIATSPIHMQYKLRMQPDQVVEQAVRAVKKARSLCADVEFSCEDVGRSEYAFLCRTHEAAIDPGPPTLHTPQPACSPLPHPTPATPP